jgi:DNA-binding SARP family transcriptional activator
MLKIRLLGPTSILVDDQPVLLKRRKSRALLYYIAAQPQPITRRQSATLLWGDHTDKTARHNLRTTLYGLRQELDEYLHIEEERIGLEDAEVDARIFAAALERPQNTATIEELSQVLELYQGDFLADFDLPDSEEYEDWIAVEREHYRRLAIRGFQRVSQYYEAQQDYSAALSALSRALLLDPFQEDLQREGLRLHYYAGDRAGAIRRYEEFTRLLDAEMGVPPMAETRALYDAIITDNLTIPSRVLTPVSQPPVVSPPISHLPTPRVVQPTAPSGPPFTGRADELRRLAELRTAHQLILVEGEAGMGKTRLLETYIARVQMADGDIPPPLVLIGRARQLESRLPLQPIIEALRSLVATPAWETLRPHINLPAVWWWEIARLLPEIAEPDPAAAMRAPDESRLWEGIFQLLAALAEQQPMILFIDDLHWADAATLGLLGYLVRQAAAAQLPITLLAASRPAQPGTELAILQQALSREDLLVRLQLDRLEVDAVMALARWLSPTHGYPLGNWLYRSSEGNPFVLAGLVRYIRDEQILLPDGRVNLTLLPSTPVVPPTVYALIQSRLATLSDAARRVLDAAVAIGREFEFELVARAAALSDTATLDALDELRQARLIHALDEQRFAFDHTLTMEVAYQEVGELRHRLLHRRVASALESIHDDSLDEVAGLIAQHYAEGDQPDLAAKYARRAGERAVRLAAWKSAAVFFRQALVGAPVNELPELLVALGNAQLHGGELIAAEETLRQALDLELIQRQIETLDAALKGLSETLILQARYSAVMELAQAYADHPHANIRAIAQFMWGASLSLEGLELGAAKQHLLASKEELQAASETEQNMMSAKVEFELGNIMAQQGDLEAAIAHYQQTLTLSLPDKSDDKAADDNLRSHILAYNNLAYHLHLMGDPRAADYIQRGLALAQEKGMLATFPYLLSTRGEIALAEEDFATAEASFNQALADAQRLNQPERVAGVMANLGLVAQARGQIDLAIHRLSMALTQADAISSRFLAAQIRLWLASLLPSTTATPYLAEARAIITTGGYYRLLPHLERLEAKLALR